MKRILPLLLSLALIPALAATCTTPATQKSPSGPWVGEVKNDTDAVASDSLVRGDITDATGRVQSIAAPTCPTRLAAGETGTWEIFADGYGLVPPLTGVFRHESTPVDLGGLSTGLIASIEGTDPARRAAAVTITNRSRDAIGGISICASMRDASGALIEVGNTRVVPSQLAPGASTTAALYFASMPPGATFDLNPQGQKLCCGPGVVPVASFTETARLVANAGFADYPGVTRGLIVVGEVTALRDIDLVGTIASAHITGKPLLRLDRVNIGCSGVVPRGEKVPVTFMLPIPPGTDERRVAYTIDGISGSPSYGDPMFRLPVTNVEGDQFGLSGDVVNNRNERVRVNGICFSARDGGRLVGSGYLPSADVLAPDATQGYEASFGVIGDPDTFQIIAYAELTRGLPALIPVP